MYIKADERRGLERERGGGRERERERERELRKVVKGRRTCRCVRSQKILFGKKNISLRFLLYL